MQNRDSNNLFSTQEIRANASRISSLSLSRLWINSGWELTPMTSSSLISGTMIVRLHHCRFRHMVKLKTIKLKTIKLKSILWKPSYQGIVRDDHFFVDSSSGLRGQAQSQYLAEDSRRNAGTETMLIWNSFEWFYAVVYLVSHLRKRGREISNLSNRAADSV